MPAEAIVAEMSPAPGIALLQLDAEAPPGLLAAAGGELILVDPSAPELHAAGALIVLGSAVSSAADPLDTAFSAVVETMRDRVRNGDPILGIGAGAQLLAIALGGAARAGGAHEFGYVDLVPTAATAADPVLRGLGAGLPVMEWHDAAIDLPDEVEVLARCERGRVQAFRGGQHGYGLRFHPGATTEIVRRWAALRAAASNNPAVPVRIGAEIVRHQERAERFGRGIVAGWLGLSRARKAASNSGTSLDRS